MSGGMHKDTLPWFPSQHYDSTFALQRRFVMHAAQMTIDEETQKLGFVRGSLGDILGLNLWRERTREIPGHAFVWPATTMGLPQNPRRFAVSRTRTRTTGTTRPAATVSALPLVKARSPDDTFIRKTISFPGAGDYGLPDRWPGMVLSGTDAYGSRDMFFPAYGPLVASVRGNPKASAIVSDCRESVVDPTRQAQLHSLVEVVKGLSARSAGFFGDNFVRSSSDRISGNAVALQLGPAPLGAGGWGTVVGFSGLPKGGLSGTLAGLSALAQGEPLDGDPTRTRTRTSGSVTRSGQGSTTRGTPGAFTDEPPDPVNDGPARQVVAMLSAEFGGFIDLGDPGDVHQVGEDKDGRPAIPAHLNVDALWRGRGGDGRLAFTNEAATRPQIGPHAQTTFLVWDTVIKAWVWETFGFLEVDDETSGGPVEDGPTRTRDPAPPADGPAGPSRGPSPLRRTPRPDEGPERGFSREPLRTGQGGVIFSPPPTPDPPEPPDDPSDPSDTPGGGIGSGGSVPPDPDSPNPTPFGPDQRPVPGPPSEFDPDELAERIDRLIDGLEGEAGDELPDVVAAAVEELIDGAAIPEPAAGEGGSAPVGQQVPTYGGVEHTAWPTASQKLRLGGGMCMSATPSATGETNVSGNTFPMSSEVKAETKGPDVFNMEAYGLGDRWATLREKATRRPGKRHTSSGGIVFTAAFDDLKRALEGKLRNEHTLHVVIPPSTPTGGTRFAFGTPDQKTGLKSGVIMRPFADGMRWEVVDSVGNVVASPRFDFGEGGGVFTGNLSVTGELTDVDNIVFDEQAADPMSGSEVGLFAGDQTGANGAFWRRDDGSLVRLDLGSSGFLRGFQIRHVDLDTYKIFPGECSDSDADFLLSSTSVLSADKSVPHVVLTGLPTINGFDEVDLETADGITGTQAATTTITMSADFTSRIPQFAGPGTIEITVTDVIGVGTVFSRDLAEGDMIGNDTDGWGQITSVDSDTVATIQIDLIDGDMAAGSSYTIMDSQHIRMGASAFVFPAAAISGSGITWIMDITSETHTDAKVTIGQPRAFVVGQFLYVYVVADSSGTVGALISGSRFGLYGADKFPSFRRVGAAPLQPSSESFFAVNYYGEGQHRMALYEIGENVFQVLSGGTATAWTKVDCREFVPPTASRVRLLATALSMGVARTMYLRTSGAAAANSALTRELHLHSASSMDASFPVETGARFQSVDYVMDSAVNSSGNLNGLGFMDDL